MGSLCCMGSNIHNTSQQQQHSCVSLAVLLNWSLVVNDKPCVPCALRPLTVTPMQVQVERESRFHMFTGIKNSYSFGFVSETWYNGSQHSLLRDWSSFFPVLISIFPWSRVLQQVHWSQLKSKLWTEEERMCQGWETAVELLKMIRSHYIRGSRYNYYKM